MPGVNALALPEYDLADPAATGLDAGPVACLPGSDTALVAAEPVSKIVCAIACGTNTARDTPAKNRAGSSPTNSLSSLNMKSLLYDANLAK
ncbi:MAG TPA: hypothetical protein V6C72_03845 [Chroococcales cyanobacterium]